MKPRLLHVAQHRAVHIGRHARLLMPSPRRDLRDGHAPQDQPRDPTVPQIVRGEPGDAGRLAGPLERVPDAVRSDAEDWVAFWEYRAQLDRARREPVLVALPVPHPQTPFDAIDIDLAKRARLSDPQARGFQQRDRDGVVRLEVVESAEDLLETGRLDHRATLPGQPHAPVPSRVRVDAGVVEHHREDPERDADRLPRLPLLNQRGDQLLHRDGRDSSQRLLPDRLIHDQLREMTVGTTRTGGEVDPSSQPRSDRPGDADLILPILHRQQPDPVRQPALSQQHPRPVHARIRLLPGTEAPEVPQATLAPTRAHPHDVPLWPAVALLDRYMDARHETATLPAPQRSGETRVMRQPKREQRMPAQSLTGGLPADSSPTSTVGPTKYLKTAPSGSMQRYARPRFRRDPRISRATGDAPVNRSRTPARGEVQ